MVYRRRFTLCALLSFACLVLGGATAAQQTGAANATAPPVSGAAPAVPKVLAAPGFAKARVATNPAAPQATAVGERTCIACHQLEADHFTHTLHSLGLHAANKTDPAIPVCEVCHGPGSAHAKDPTAKGLIIG